MSDGGSGAKSSTLHINWKYSAHHCSCLREGGSCKKKIKNEILSITLNHMPLLIIYCTSFNLHRQQTVYS